MVTIATVPVEWVWVSIGRYPNIRFKPGLCARLTLSSVVNGLKNLLLLFSLSECGMHTTYFQYHMYGVKNGQFVCITVKVSGARLTLSGVVNGFLLLFSLSTCPPVSCFGSLFI